LSAAPSLSSVTLLTVLGGVHLSATHGDAGGSHSATAPSLSVRTILGLYQFALPYAVLDVIGSLGRHCDRPVYGGDLVDGLVGSGAL